MIHISVFDVISGLLEEDWFEGFSIEYFSRYTSINISPKWRHQSGIVADRESIWSVLGNLAKEGNNAIRVDLRTMKMKGKNDSVTKIIILLPLAVFRFQTDVE